MRHLKQKAVQELPLVALLVVTIFAAGILAINAYPNTTGSVVVVGGLNVNNPYYTNSNTIIPDLDNCPGGPNSRPCYDRYGIAVACTNPSQDDDNYNLLGNICDVCGNGTIDAAYGESCEIGNLDGRTCNSLDSKYYAISESVLGCTSGCSFDLSGCQYCGDGRVTAGLELCDDGANTNTPCPTVASCAAQGLGLSGTGCNQRCQTNCGNGLCDNGESYTTCPADCPAPVVCGDGSVGSGESCDYGTGNNTSRLYQNAPTCTATGYTATCNPQSTYSSCEAGCGQENTDLCSVYISADDNYDVWINGQRVVSKHTYSSPPPGGFSWYTTTDYDAQYFNELEEKRINKSIFNLTGQNVVAVKGYDWPENHFRQGLMLTVSCDVGGTIIKTQTGAAGNWRCKYSSDVAGANTGNFDATDPNWKNIGYVTNGWATPVLGSADGFRYSVNGAQVIWGAGTQPVATDPYWSYAYCRYEFDLGGGLGSPGVCSDNDGDGYSGFHAVDCATGTDCNDGNPAIHPGGTEICGDGIDQDCSGSDLACAAVTYYRDVDGDSYFSLSPSGSCSGTGCQPAGSRLTPGNDCNDGNAAIHPGQTDASCDGVDNNCAGGPDEGYVPTATSCGVGACAATGQNVCQNGTIVNTCAPAQPGAEICTDSLDNDCDGLLNCADPNCAGQSDGAGQICCTNAGDCLAGAPGNCALPVCGANHCSYLPDATRCVGNCDACNTSTLNCQANQALCEGASCLVCQGSGTAFSCQAQPSGEDTIGAAQCLAPSTCSGGTCVTPCTAGDSDRDGICEDADVCPYDPNNDADGDGLCVVGCTTGSSRTGTKTNGFICNNSSAISYDDCLGGGCTNANSCKVVFGAQDYFNLSINGRLVSGSLNLPKYGSQNGYNDPGKPIDQTTLRVDSGIIFQSGQNVVTLEAIDQVGGANNARIRGVFANFADTATCSVLPVIPTVTRDAGGSNPLPLRCYVIADDARDANGAALASPPLDSAGRNWQDVLYDDSTWSASVVGTSTGGACSLPIEQRLWGSCSGKPYSGFPVWGAASGNPTATNHVFCRHTFTIP